MKIMVDARTMGSHPSGIGFYLYDFLKELTKNKHFCFELLTDVAESEQILALQNNGIRVTCYGKKVFRSIGVYPYFYFVKRILQKKQPDFFWEPNNLIPIALRGFHGNVILTIHDLFPITKPEYYSRFYRIYFKKGVRRSIQMASAILFVSEETKQSALKRFPEIRGKKSFVTYLIVNSANELPAGDDGYFLYIGNLETRKGVDLLLKAYASYHAAGGKKPLYLGGSVREKTIANLLEEIKGTCSSIKYLGYVSTSEKKKLLSGCCCFVFPSRAEGFGLPPLEAMSYQKAVITSNLPIFQEILQGQTNTFRLDQSKEAQIRQLCDLLFHYTLSKEQKKNYKVLLNNYQPEILGTRLSLFLQSLEECCDSSI